MAKLYRVTGYYIIGGTIFIGILAGNAKGFNPEFGPGFKIADAMLLLAMMFPVFTFIGWTVCNAKKLL